jgi:uncharacterized protein YecE (DUF72 family)
MRILPGSSGFSYRPWKGAFYPPELGDEGWLAHYTTRLPTVEINNTFYRMPRANVMAAWAREAAPGFRFAIKAPRRITHLARLADTRELVAALWSAVQELGAALGPVLFQLPPHARKEAARLAEFLAGLPQGMRAVLEFRHASWHDEEVLALLREHRACLCASDVGQLADAGIDATTDWGYLRLRQATYADEELRGLIAKLRAQPWQEAYVFFKHDEAAPGPEGALQLARLLERPAAR